MRDRLEALYVDNPMGRYTFTALFCKYSLDKEGTYNALFVQVWRNGRFAADHIWTRRTGAMKKLDLRAGDEVEFEAQIERYARNPHLLHMQSIDWDYGLVRVKFPKVLKRRKDEGNGNV